MSGKADFLARVFRGAIRPIDTTSDVLRKAPDGVLIMTPFLGGDFYFIRGPIGWKPNGDADPTLEKVEVPEGFVTDLASIPRILWPILPKDGDYAQPAVIHDYMYWCQQKPKRTADRVFQLGMKELQVSFWKTAIIYLAVSWLGGRAWRKNSRLKELGEKRILIHYPRENVKWSIWKLTKPSSFVDCG